MVVVAKVSVAFSVVLSVDWSRVVELVVVVPLGAAVPATELESAIRVFAVVEVVVAALLLLEVEKAKARTAGVSCRLVKQNIQRTMDILRAAKNAEEDGDDGIQL